MPNLDDELNEKQLARILIYGAAKTKKTWWAGAAAEAGFNVLMLSGENGAGILKQLTPAARERVYVLNIADVSNQAKMAIFMARFCKYNKFFWNEDTKMPNGNYAEGYSEINPKLLDSNTVVVLDTYTSLVWSIMYRYAIENLIDLSDASKTEWDGYGWAGNLATWMLHQLIKLPCHFIMVAHADMYEKVNKQDKSKIDFSRTQIKSTSRPHAMQIADKFSDIFYFSVKGSAFKIDATSGDNRDGGSRSVHPKVYNWDDLQFAAVCKNAGIALPTDAPRLDFTAKQPASKAKKPSAVASANANKPGVIDSSGKSTGIKLGGLSLLQSKG